MTMNKPDLKFYDQMSTALWDLADANDRQTVLKRANSIVGLLSDYIPGMEHHKLQLAIVRESHAPYRAGEGTRPGMDDEDGEQGTGSIPEGTS